MYIVVVGTWPYVYTNYIPISLQNIVSNVLVESARRLCVSDFSVFLQFATNWGFSRGVCPPTHGSSFSGISCPPGFVHRFFYPQVSNCHPHSPWPLTIVKFLSLWSLCVSLPPFSSSDSLCLLVWHVLSSLPLVGLFW